MSSPYLGEIRMFAGNFAPFGWALCQGQLLAISQNTALFSLLGTYYGGNGTTNFALPDLRSRIPLGQGTGTDGNTYVIGEMSGEEQVGVTSGNLPSHGHPLNARTVVGTTNSPSNAAFAEPTEGGRAVVDYYATVGTVVSTAPVTDTGGGTTSTIYHDNISPSLAMNYIIALQGVYPSRN